MIQVYIGLGVLLVVGVIVWVLRVQHLRTTARDRLYVDTVETELKQDYLQLTPSLRRHYAIPWVIALAIGATLLLVVRIPLVYCVSITIIVGVIGYLIEGWNASRAALKIETQLAN